MASSSETKEISSANNKGKFTISTKLNDIIPNFKNFLSSGGLFYAIFVSAGVGTLLWFFLKSIFRRGTKDNRTYNSQTTSSDPRTLKDIGYQINEENRLVKENTGDVAQSGISEEIPIFRARLISIFDLKQFELNPFHPKQFVEEIETSSESFWSRKYTPLYQIAIDYGRSHYFTIAGGSRHITEEVHRYVFRDSIPLSDSERLEFLNSIGISGPTVLTHCENVGSPFRADILSRTKYELLKKYFSENGIKNSSEMALTALAFSTQHTLRLIKKTISAHVREIFSDEIEWSFFQTDFNVTTKNDNDVVMMNVSFCNYIPPSHLGAWQTHRLISSKNALNVRAVFSVQLDEFITEATQQDISPKIGSLLIHTEGKHDFYGHEFSLEEKKTLPWGIFFNGKETIKFRDTFPTW